jgi:hypothetical protein
MIKTILALATVAALAAAVPAYAQETIGATGRAVDGHGAGGSQANRDHPDGPSGSYLTRADDGTCYLHTRDSVLVVRCPITR